MHDTAAILDNKIIEGPSFQLRKGSGDHIFNLKAKDNFVFTKGTPRKLRNLAVHAVGRDEPGVWSLKNN